MHFVCCLGEGTICMEVTKHLVFFEAEGGLKHVLHEKVSKWGRLIHFWLLMETYRLLYSYSLPVIPAGWFMLLSQASSFSNLCLLNRVSENVVKVWPLFHSSLPTWALEKTFSLKSVSLLCFKVGGVKSVLHSTQRSWIVTSSCVCTGFVSPYMWRICAWFTCDQPALKFKLCTNGFCRWWMFDSFI